jgi:alpha-L-fucosidase
MYDSNLSDWTAAKMGPRRDLIGELAAAVRKQWMVFGLSSHRAEHWWFFGPGMGYSSDVRDAKYAGLYGPAQHRDTQPNDAFLGDWLARTCELVDKYRPQLLWFDWWIEQPSFEPYLRAFAAYYYNRAAEWRTGVAVNYKHRSFADGSAVLDIERGQLAGIGPRFWQNDTSVSRNSWGYVHDQDYKTAADLIGDLADVVSKNGALLLNIGPRPDGTIPQEEVELLERIGEWLALNGEAIYDTRPWSVFGEGPTEVVEGSFADTKRSTFTPRDIRFTTNGETLYAILLGWPESGEAVVQSLGTNLRLYQKPVHSVELLGHVGTLRFSRTARGLRVKLPGEKPCRYAWVLKIR